MGWGYEDEQPSLEELRDRGARHSRSPRLRRRGGRAAGSARSGRAAGAAADAAGLAGGDLHDRRRTTAPRTRTARRTGISCGPFAGASTTCPTWSPFPATRARSRDVLEWCGERGAAVIPYGGGTSVVGGVEARVGDELRGRGDARPRPARPRARDRPDLARGADPGRRDRARPRGPAARARPHAAPLPAVVPALDARRVDRDARGRSLRDSLHAHRRPRRVDLRRDAGRRHRDAPAARIGRGAEPRPHAARIGGHPRSDHRGVGARAGPSRAQGVGGGHLSGLRRGRRGGARARAERPLPDQLPAARSARGGDHRCVARTGALLVLGFESADHPVDAWMERALELAADHGGNGRPQARERSARTRSAPGATRSCALLPARHVRRLRGDQRHVRDRDHVGPLPAVPRLGDGGGRGRGARGLRRRAG